MPDAPQKNGPSPAPRRPGHRNGGPPRQYRLPWQPFEDLLAGIERGREPIGHHIQAIAKHFGVSNRAIYRWRDEGLTIAKAEELCHRIGHHPAEVWTHDVLYGNEPGVAA